MKKLLVNVIEKGFHPLLMPLYGTLLPFLYTDLYFLNKLQCLRFFLLIASTSFILPIMAEIFLRLTNKSWFQLQEKRLYMLPYALSVLLTTSLLFLFLRIGVPFWYIGLLLSSVIVLFVTTVIGYSWNISKILLGIGGILGSMMSICYFIKGVNPFVLFIFIFIIAGFIGSLQLATEKHSKPQVYFGFLLGFLLGFLSLFLSIYLFYLFR